MRQEKASILIVDDRHENLVAFETLLAPLGHEIVLAHSGEDALKQAIRRSFGVIVMDVRMPGLTGFETASILRKREAYRVTPIIFTSAHDVEVADVLGGYVAGATDFVETPGNSDLLKFKVASFVELHLKFERTRKRAQEVYKAFESLKSELAKTGGRGSLLERQSSEVEQALLRLEGELSNRSPR